MENCGGVTDQLIFESNEEKKPFHDCIYVLLTIFWKNKQLPNNHTNNELY